MAENRAQITLSKLEKCKTISAEIDGLSGTLTKYVNGNPLPEKNSSQKTNNPRSVKVEFNFNTEVYVRKVEYSPELSQLQVIGIRNFIENKDSVLTPDTAILYHFYQRKRTPKVLCAAFFNNKEPVTNINFLLTIFDAYFAVDTNTRVVEGIGVVSVSAVWIGKISNMPGLDTSGVNKHFYAEVNFDIQGKAENFAWKRLIETIEKDSQFDELKNIGIIVDSDLEELEHYNAQRKPLYADFYLPKRFQIIFATDASGSQEFVPNKLIKICDKTATETLVALLESDVLENMDRSMSTMIEDSKFNLLPDSKP